ncbi:MAG: M23 family metallopeptidase [Candidatus Woykebacteria bacterium]
MTNQQDPEGSLSYPTTTYPYELDFVQDNFYTRPNWFSWPLGVAKFIWTLLKLVSVSSLKISWDYLTFSLHYIMFTQRRAVAFVYFLEQIKDALVSVLMWRRGLLFRPSTHVGLLVLASVALVVGSLFRAGVAAEDFSRDQVLSAENTPVTLIPSDRPRSEIVKYKVEKGDTLSKVASAYSISVDSIKWANNLDDVDTVKPGDTLAVPPVTGVIHKVKKSDTIYSVAKKYKANAQTIANYPFNYIDDTLKLRVGESLIVPGGKMPPPTPLPTAPSGPRNYPIYYAGGSGLFAWPVKGTLNQAPSWWHPAIDIGAPYGAVVSAAMAGTVVEAGWSNLGFGNDLVIAHPNGYTTLYAHLSSIKAKAGQAVVKGQQIGNVGCTGFCTGPHLHLEVRRGNRNVNPLSVLP